MLTAADQDEIMSAMPDEQSNHRHQDAVQNEGRVSYQDFMQMTDQQIQTVREVVIPLSKSYFADPFYGEPRRDDLNRQLEKNRNITVVLDCVDAKRIENNCLNSIKEMHKIKIIHAENVENIRGSFLYNCSGLTTLDLSPLSNVKSIGDGFLAVCRRLTTLDLRPLSNVREIGFFFLYVCVDLTTLDLTPLSNVTAIGNDFLAHCHGLTTIDLSPLSNVITIGDTFLAHCGGLITIDISPLSNVTTIGEYFLFDCRRLTRSRVTRPQNWNFEDRLPENLRQPRATQSAQNARPVSAIAQRMIDDLRERHIDPKRDSDDYTSLEFSMASALLQGAGGTEDDYLQRLEEVFSTARAFMLLQDITNAEDHSSDSDSDHLDR
ncbi:MAG: hypothetical protein NEHIOOID_00501 [Holosporales bacterium]